MKKQLITILALITLVAGVLPLHIQAAEPRSAAEREAEQAARQHARSLEAQSRELARLKEIDLRFEEQYYTKIVPHFDAVSIDMYANFLPVMRRIGEVEFRMENLIYNVMRSRGIALQPVAGQPLPDGVAAFDVEDKFYNAQACADGFYRPSPGATAIAGNCLLYDIPPSGVATTSAGLTTIQPPGLGIGGWTNFLDDLSVIPGGFNFGFGAGGSGGWSPPLSLFPILPPPFLPQGVRFTTGATGTLIAVPDYGPQSLQIVTGYASNCMVGVPARYFPEYYVAQNSGATIADALALPLEVTLDTPCDLISLAQQALTNLLTNLLNKIFPNANLTINTLPFPEYGALPGTIANLPPIFPDYPAIDYCPPLDCKFVENGAFDFAVDMQAGAFRQHIFNMRDGLERIRQAYRALNHDILEALEYHQKTQ